MKVIKSNVTQQVIEYLKENIMDGSWPVGEKIPSENQLTEMLGVSRASVRVAIQQFVALGALESVHGKGTFVKSNRMDALSNRQNNITADDCKDIRKVLEFRRIVESECCFLATEHVTPELLDALRKHLSAMQENVGHSDAFVRADILFHEEISHASGNQLLEKSLREVFEQTIRNHHQLNALFGYKDGLYYHNIIIKALEERKPKLARKLMFEHLQQAIDRIEI